jgi:MFS family permease
MRDDMTHSKLLAKNPLVADAPVIASTSRIPAIVIAMSSFLVTFDITAVIVAMPKIKSELGLDVSGFAWVMDAYSLSFTVLLMAAGVLADRYGRRKALLLGNLVFGVASLACGLARVDVFLWAARAVQGLGAAFVICGGLALLSDRYREQGQRVKAFALAGTVSGAAMALGPSGGGLVADLAGWRWVFLVNLPICAFIGFAVPKVIQESRDPTQRRVDIAGVVTLTLTLLSLVWLLLHGTEVAGVKLPSYLAASIPAACFVLFIASQRRQKAPMIELAMFASPAFLGICLVPLALSIAYWSLLVYLPLFLRGALGQTLDRISWLMLAATAPMLLLPFAGARIAIMLKPRAFFSSGLAVVGIGCLVLAHAAQTANLWLTLLGMVLCGAGTAAVNSQVSGAIVALAPKERAGTASAIATILRQGGFAVGIAALGALLNRAGASTTAAVTAAGYMPLFASAGSVSFVAAVCVLLLVKAPSSAMAT